MEQKRLRLPRRIARMPVSIKPYEDQLDGLRRIAGVEGISVTDVMRSAFDLAIETHTGKRNAG
jgi:hypothetical protein